VSLTPRTAPRAARLLVAVVAGLWSGSLGEVPVAAPDGPGVLVVRQEGVRLVGPGEPGADGVVVVVVVATVSSRRCSRGTALRLRVDCRGTEVAVVVPSTAAVTAAVTAGERLRVHLPPEHCSVVPPD
jgi:TOBE domain